MDPTDSSPGPRQEPLPQEPTTIQSQDTHALNAQSYNAIAPRYLQWTLSQHPPLPDLDSLISTATTSQIEPSSSTDPQAPLPPNPRLILLPQLLSLLSPSSRVLDLGCGAGVPCTLMLAQHCWEGKVSGVDSSEVQIKLARDYVRGLRRGEGTDDGAGTEGQVQQGIGGDSVRISAPGTNDDFDDDKHGDVVVANTETEREGPNGEKQNAKKRMLAETDFVVADMVSLSYPSGTFDAVVAFYSIIHLPREEQREMLSRIAVWLTQEKSDHKDNSGGYLLLNLGTSDDPGSYADKWLGSTDGRMFWSSFDAATNLDMIEGAGFDVLKSVVIYDDNHGKPKVPFLWVLAKKK